VAGELPQVDPCFTSTTTADGRHVIAVAGELDLYTTPQLVAELETLTPQGPEIVLDLNEVSFVDSTALGAILLASRRLRQAGGTLALVCASPSTVKLLTLVGVDRVVPVYETTDAALAPK
jgi:anti-sigma B factor antagonist